MKEGVYFCFQQDTVSTTSCRCRQNRTTGISPLKAFGQSPHVNVLSLPAPEVQQGPEIPQLLILASPIGPPAAQEAISFFMASPHADPAACYCWILWSGSSHTPFGIQGGTFFHGDVSTLFFLLLSQADQGYLIGLV